MKHRKRLAICLLAMTGAASLATAQCGAALLTATDAAEDDFFGWAVAMQADRIVVGAPFADAAGVDSGAAYIFEREGAGWIQVAKLVADDAAEEDEFGRSVSMDGDRVLIGSRVGDGVVANSGAAYVFRRDVGGWIQEAKLIASDGEGGDYFGLSVALSGGTALVGAPLDDDLGFASGAAYVYELQGQQWVEVVKWLPSDGDVDNSFGNGVSLDGDLALVGAHRHDHPFNNTGSLYVFEQEPSGTWPTSPTIELLASDAGGWDLLGYLVAASGNWALATAPGDDGDQGAAYLFQRAAPGVWGPNETIKLKASDRSVGDFPARAAMSPGNVLLGSCGDDDQGSNAGAAYLFAQAASGIWPANETVKILMPGGTTGDCAGFSVAISGSVCAIGAPTDDHSGILDAGSVHVLLPTVGTPYCFGSPGACPCGNGGGAEEGCSNSTGAGASLCAGGSARLWLDDLSFFASGLLPGQPALLFAGESAAGGGSGLSFGDGLRCAGTNVRRLGVRVPDAGGRALWGPGLAATGGWAAGDTRYFQGWYRDPAGSPCSTGFNLTNGVQVELEL